MSLGLLLEQSVSFSVTIQLCYRPISYRSNIIGHSEAALPPEQEDQAFAGQAWLRMSRKLKGEITLAKLTVTKEQEERWR
jgi:hypothetical protein